MSTNGHEKKVKGLLVEYGKMSVDLKALKASSGVELLETSVERIKSEVAELTKTIGATVSGDGYQAVLSPEREYGAWDDEKLQSFAAGITDDGLRTRLLALREVKSRSASVSIRVRK